jgi:hypothetical protein
VDKEGRTWLINAKGMPVKLLAIKPVDFQTETLKIQAFPSPDFDGKNCPVVASPHFAVPTILDGLCPDQ